MSSWIPSLFNPFADDDNSTSPRPSSPTEATPRSPSSGVKDDLSAVFRGVTAFLAPPPQKDGASASSSETIAGIKNDLAEIQGSFRSGLSLISSRLSSNLMQLQKQFDEGDEDDEGEEEEGLGITEAVLEFVLKISRRPELWTDFPLSLPDDFSMSDSQREHAADIEHLVPEFQTLKQKICSQMSAGKFWLIYFILLVPRLDEEDLKLLSTPQVAEARETLLKKLQQKNGESQETSQNPQPSETNSNTKEYNNNASERKGASAETENATKQKEIVDETGVCHQPKETHTLPSDDTQKQSGKEEDISFSDLEDDENDRSDKASTSLGGSSGSQGAKQKVDGSKDKESEGEDSNDWLTVDDTDFDNLAAI